ncbi:MAG: TetR family transcriptional regulator [Myxococcota bacterium]
MAGVGASAGRNRKKQVAQTGRLLGARALKTRQRLLDATAQLLVERSVLDIAVVEIARKAGTSPATFYHYFKDVDEAALALAEQAADEMPALVELIDANWSGRQGLETARSVARAFMEHWSAHHAVLLIRNLSADKGDRRFQQVRRTALAPVLDHLAARISEAQEAGRVSPDTHPYAASAALVSILESLSAHARELQRRNVSGDQLVETCARILYQVITGRRAG